VVVCWWPGAEGFPQTALERHETAPFRVQQTLDGRYEVAQEVVLVLMHPAGIQWAQLPPLQIAICTHVFDADLPRWHTHSHTPAAANFPTILENTAEVQRRSSVLLGDEFGGFRFLKESSAKNAMAADVRGPTAPPLWEGQVLLSDAIKGREIPSKNRRSRANNMFQIPVFSPGNMNEPHKEGGGGEGEEGEEGEEEGARTGSAATSASGVIFAPSSTAPGRLSRAEAETGYGKGGGMKEASMCVTMHVTRLLRSVRWAALVAKVSERSKTKTFLRKVNEAIEGVQEQEALFQRTLRQRRNKTLISCEWEIKYKDMYY